MAMSDLTNKIVLRPRFELLVSTTKTQILERFEKTHQKPFLNKCLDNHIFIRFDKAHTTFWSPQLHLELTNFGKKQETTIHGVFGPNPSLWTFFMFIHFGVATLFILLGIWAYSKHALGHETTPIIIGMVFLVIIWFVLYTFGRMGKSKGRAQMKQLFEYFSEVLQDLYPESSKNHLR